RRPRGTLRAAGADVFAGPRGSRCSHGLARVSRAILKCHVCARRVVVSSDSIARLPRDQQKSHPAASESSRLTACAPLRTRPVSRPDIHPLKANHYMTNETTASATTQVAINDIGSADDFLAAVEKTLKFFNDGDIIDGEIVKIDRDEVLLDVGYKTEGVIPSRELSIKHD